MIGAVTGAYLLSDKIDGDIIKPFMSAYLAILGILILRKALQRNKPKSKTKRLGPLAFSAVSWTLSAAAAGARS